MGENVPLTWYPKPGVTVYSFLTLATFSGNVNHKPRFIRSIHYCNHFSFFIRQRWLSDDVRMLICRRLFVVKTVIKFVHSCHTAQSCHMFRESESLFEAFAPHMLARDSCVLLSGLHRKHDR